MWKRLNDKLGYAGKIAAALVSITVLVSIGYGLDRRYSRPSYAEYKQHEATATINQIDLSLDNYRKFCGPELNKCKTERDRKRVRELLEQRKLLDTQRQEYWKRRSK